MPRASPQAGSGPREVMGIPHDIPIFGKRRARGQVPGQLYGAVWRPQDAPAAQSVEDRQPGPPRMAAQDSFTIGWRHSRAGAMPEHLDGQGHPQARGQGIQQCLPAGICGPGDHASRMMGGAEPIALPAQRQQGEAGADGARQINGKMKAQAFAAISVERQAAPMRIFGDGRAFTGNHTIDGMSLPVHALAMETDC